MSKITEIVDDVIAKTNTNTTDIATIETIASSHIGISGVTAYHLLQGNLAVDNTVTTQGFNTTLYTSGSATTNIDMNTQWGNTVEEKFGGLVWLKDRVEATNNFLYDTIRGATKEINSNTTDAEATLAGGLTAFNSTGFTVGADAGHNSTTNNMVSWNFQTTHRITGTTNHGKAYTCHYNPFTGFTIVKYEGSGIAGHEIPHMLGRKLGFQVIKNLSVANDWVAGATTLGGGYLLLNTTVAFLAQTGGWYPPSGYTETSIILNVNNIADNANTNQYIMYGWANSYFDESNKLIGNYEIGTYQGTGASGNKVKTRGKPALIMINRLDSISNWYIQDNIRGQKGLYPNISNVEDNGYSITFAPDGFIASSVGETNNANGQFLYMVAYDTNSNGGGSYYPRATDTSNLQVQNAIIPFANGIDANGSKITTLSKNETISGLTLTAGKNYVYSKNDGTYGVKQHRPRYLDSDLVRTYAGESPDYYDVKSNKWFNTNSVSELITNGTFNSNTSGWTLSGSCVISNGTMLISNSGANASQTITGLDVSKKYSVKGNMSFVSGSNIGWFTINGITYGNVATNYTLDTIVSGVSQIALSLNVGTTAVYSFDNISVFEADIVPTTEIPESRNYMNHIVYADNDGSPLYVEKLPKIEYKDSLQVNSLNVISGFNLNQTWQNVTSNRVAGATYTNTTGKPIMVSFTNPTTTTHYTIDAVVDGILVANVNVYRDVAGRTSYVNFIVPANSTYRIAVANITAFYWSELR